MVLFARGQCKMRSSFPRLFPHHTHFGICLARHPQLVGRLRNAAWLSRPINPFRKSLVEINSHLTVEIDTTSASFLSSTVLYELSTSGAGGGGLLKPTALSVKTSVPSNRPTWELHRMCERVLFWRASPRAIITAFRQQPRNKNDTLGSNHCSFWLAGCVVGFKNSI